MISKVGICKLKKIILLLTSSMVSRIAMKYKKNMDLVFVEMKNWIRGF